MYAFSALANWNDVELACELPATSHPGVKLTVCGKILPCILSKICTGISNVP